MQQANDLAFFQQDNRWVDSRIVREGEQPKPDRVIQFGSPEFNQLAWKLAKQGRQGGVSLQGDILLSVDGQVVLVKNSVVRWGGAVSC